MSSHTNYKFRISIRRPNLRNNISIHSPPVSADLSAHRNTLVLLMAPCHFHTTSPRTGNYTSPRRHTAPSHPLRTLSSYSLRNHYSIPSPPNNKMYHPPVSLPATATGRSIVVVDPHKRPPGHRTSPAYLWIGGTNQTCQEKKKRSLLSLSPVIHHFSRGKFRLTQVPRAEAMMTDRRRLWRTAILTAAHMRHLLRQILTTPCVGDRSQG